MTESWHGTVNGYGYHKCRCDECRRAVSEQRKKWRARTKGRAVPERVHGTSNGYSNYNCRCQPCRDAWAAYFGGPRRAARLARGVPDHVHGTENGYGNYACRCLDCTAVWSRASKERAARRRARLAADPRQADASTADSVPSGEGAPGGR